MDGMLGREAVRDKLHYVWWTAFYMGLSTLFPWNMLITVTGYWNYKLRNVTDDSNPGDSDQLTELQKIYNSYLAIAANVPNAIFVILTALFGYKFNMKLQIFGSQAMISIIFSVVSVLAIVNTDDWQETFLYLNLALIAVLVCFNGILQGKV